MSQSSRKAQKRQRNDAEQEQDFSEHSFDIKTGESGVLVIRDSIYFRTEVCQRTMMLLQRALSEATDYAYVHSNDPCVYLYIHSAGGDAFSGLSGMDHIRCNNARVVTIADGYVASAATLLLLGGHERNGLENAKVLLHQISTEFGGKYGELLDEMENSKELMQTLQSTYEKHTTLKTKQISNMLSKDVHLSMKQCLKYGIIQNIW